MSHGAAELNDLRHAMIQRAADLAVALLGPPNPKLKSHRDLRWGRKGSLSLAVAGEKAGLWTDYESGESGDLFALIMRERGGRFPDAIKYARDFCGIRNYPQAKATRSPGSSSAIEELTRPKADPSDDQRAKNALKVFDQGTSIDHPIAKLYFERRKLVVPEGIDGPVLRFHRHCPFGEGEYLPAILALYRDISSDQPRAISRTALTQEGAKIDRKALGPWAGCVCKLTADEDVSLGLHLAEGVETAIAAMMLGFMPMWATGSAGTTAKFPVLSGVECLTIIVDHDGINPKTGKSPGREAARECSARWTGAGVAVRRVTPNTLGEDMNDIVKRREMIHG